MQVKCSSALIHHTYCPSSKFLNVITAVSSSFSCSSSSHFLLSSPFFAHIMSVVCVCVCVQLALAWSLVALLRPSKWYVLCYHIPCRFLVSCLRIFPHHRHHHQHHHWFPEEWQHVKRYVLFGVCYICQSTQMRYTQNDWTSICSLQLKRMFETNKCAFAYNARWAKEDTRKKYIQP